MAHDSKPGQSWAVAVVHGIGDAKPLDMLRQVTTAVKSERSQMQLEPHICVHVDRKKPRDAGGAPVDPHIRHGTIGASKVRFATAYWSDISSFGDSLLKLIGSLALGGMGVRYFADVCTGGKSRIVKVLNGLLLGKIWLLALGFLPIVLCTLVFSLFSFTGYYLFRNEMLKYQAWYIGVGSLVTVVGIAWLGLAMLWYLRNERSLALPIFWCLMAYGAAMGLVIIADHPRTFGGLHGSSIAPWLLTAMRWWGGQSENPTWKNRIEMLDETGIYIGFLQLLQYFCGFLVICFTAAVLVVLLIASLPRIGTAGQRRGMWFGAVCVTTMWLLMLLVLWPENLVTSTVLNLYIDERKHVLPPTDHWSLAWSSLLLFKLELNSLAQLKERMPLIWFDVFFSVLLIVIGMLVIHLVRRRNRWTRRNADTTDAHLARFRPPFAEELRWAPRLLLAHNYQVAAVLFMLTISVTALMHWTQRDKWLAATFRDMPLISGLGDLPHELFMSAANVALIVIGGIVVFLTLAHYIRQAVKLALDVVNHFAAPSSQFPIRKKIADRLDETLEFLLAPKDAPHLVVICHSQGTVIALDKLLGYQKYVDHGGWPVRRREQVWVPGLWQSRLKNEVASLTILTFGSPITHLYQHYFSTLYPSLAEYPDVVASAQDRIEGRLRWYNCYRIDDYVGTFIEPSVPGFPFNVPMPVGGHNSYWQKVTMTKGEPVTEHDVFARLFAQPGMDKVLVEVEESTPRLPPAAPPLPPLPVAHRPMMD